MGQGQAARPRAEDSEDPVAIQQHFSRMVGTGFTPSPAQAATAPTPMDPAAIHSQFSRMVATTGTALPGAAANTPARLGGSPAEGGKEIEVRGPRLSVLRIFPAAFSLCILIVFIWPILATYHMAVDESVAYWIGSYGKIALLLPLIFAVTHVVHISLGRPSKPAVLTSLVVPCVVLLVLGDVVLSSSYNWTFALSSNDCNTFAGKQELQNAWDAAYSVYSTCIEETVKKHPQLSESKAFRLYRLQECEEYETELKKHEAAWTYLRHVEDTYACSGWCTTAKPIWTFEDTMDSCSTTVSQVFSTKVQRVSWQIIIYIVFVLVCGSLALVFFGPMIRGKGMKW